MSSNFITLPHPSLADLIDRRLDRHDPDLFGLQELYTADEVNEILARRPGFGAVYFHDPQRQLLVDDPDATIFYRQSMFEVIESGNYWLSPTPDTIWSFGWATGIYRLVTWARLRYRPDGSEQRQLTTSGENSQPNWSFK